MRSKLAALCVLAAFMTNAVIAGAIPYLNNVTTWAEDTTSNRISFTSDQAIRGTGFYNTYQNITTGNIRLGSLSHGSGSYVYQSTTKMATEFFVTALKWGSEGYRAGQTIQSDESVDAAYSGAKFDFKGSTGIVPFNSKLGELTWVENYGLESSMDARFIYADKLKKNVNTSLYWNAFLIDIPDEDRFLENHGHIGLKLDSEFSGMAHIGAISLGVLSFNGMPKHPFATALIDEDYSGAFSITKNMSQDNFLNMTAVSNEWLPCCSGGWSSMDIHDQRGHGASTRGIFDCTCYIVPKAAEFQR
ncbi:MAG TPA: hypothetical protein VN455_05735 [Methanotrichaceae archaeon]|nr:hypothetical protein [Methanotrichaceae archaeon]